jgi:hypothetical protein
MATMLEDCTTEDQRYVVRYFWAKGLSTKDIHKEMFPIIGGKHLSLKEVHNLLEKRGKFLLMTKRSKQQSKYFCDARFDPLVKRWDKYISVGGGYVEE